MRTRMNEINVPQESDSPTSFLTSESSESGSVLLITLPVESKDAKEERKDAGVLVECEDARKERRDARDSVLVEREDAREERKSARVDVKVERKDARDSVSVERKYARA